jgi:hypothetical protein
MLPPLKGGHVLYRYGHVFYAMYTCCEYLQKQQYDKLQQRHSGVAANCRPTSWAEPIALFPEVTQSAIIKHSRRSLVPRNACHECFSRVLIVTASKLTEGLWM